VGFLKAIGGHGGTCKISRQFLLN